MPLHMACRFLAPKDMNHLLAVQTSSLAVQTVQMTHTQQYVVHLDCLLYPVSDYMFSKWNTQLGTLPDE